jgi:hypothetical protein
MKEANLNLETVKAGMVLIEKRDEENRNKLQQPFFFVLPKDMYRKVKKAGLLTKNMYEVDFKCTTAR